MTEQAKISSDTVLDANTRPISRSTASSGVDDGHANLTAPNEQGGPSGITIPDDKQGELENGAADASEEEHEHGFGDAVNESKAGDGDESNSEEEDDDEEDEDEDENEDGDDKSVVSFDSNFPDDYVLEDDEALQPSKHTHPLELFPSRTMITNNLALRTCDI